MRILGLDLSLRSTGYVLLEDDLVAWHGAVGSETLRETERLAMFDRWMRHELRERRFDHVAIEGYSFASKNQREALGELGGVIKLAIHQAGIPIHVIASGTWKKLLCGNGALKKDQVRLELALRYGIEFTSQDTLDAWAVAMCCRRQLLGVEKPEPRVRRRRAADGVIQLEAAL